MRRKPHFPARAVFGLLASLCIVAFSACAAATVTPTAPTIPAPTRRPTSAPTLTPMPPAPTAAPTETPAPAQPTATTMPPPTSAPSARYRLVFEATWSAATHPTDFPANPHFSGLIGATHSDGARLWEVGEAASPGIKNMAETGGKSPLTGEIAALINGGTACAEISGGGINPSPGTVSVEFTATQDCPLVSVVSMIAPSPDWFVGVSGLSLYEDGDWVEEKTVPLFAYDAGTDSGSSYASPNQPTAPPEPIHRLESAPVLTGSDIPPFGTFTFTRLDN